MRDQPVMLDRWPASADGVDGDDQRVCEQRGENLASHEACCSCQENCSQCCVPPFSPGRPPGLV
jgi:hypothetical protein